MSDSNRISPCGSVTIPVMHCFDNNYVVPATVSFSSMLEHADPKYYYALYVLHTDITVQNQKLLQKIVENFPNASLEFISMNHWLEDIFNSLKFSEHLSKEVIYKLSVASIFPQYEKLIITDVDVLFCGDIAPSYFALDENSEVCFAGTHHVCPKGTWLDSYYDNYTREFGVGARDQLKICGGFLVANLNQLRKKEKEKIFLDYLEHNTYRLLQLEQDVINFCCNQQEIQYLPLNYVVCSYVYDVFADANMRTKDAFYTEDQITDAMKNPIQLHYATASKPWKEPFSTKANLWMQQLIKLGLYQHYYNWQCGIRMPSPEILESIPKNPASSGNDVMVSVLCATFNHKQYIREALDGILSQKVDFPYEVIVADDASTDGTQEIIREYADKYPNLVRPILRKENVGIGYNYYDALCHVRGKYLAICDGDDCWIKEDKLQKAIAFMEKHQDVDVTCNSFERWEYNQNGDIVKSVFSVNDYIQSVYPLKEQYNFRDLLYCHFVASCTLVLRWQFSSDTVPTFLKVYSTIDFPLTLLHAAHGKIAVLSDEPTARYRVHSQGLTSQKHYKMKNETKQILLEVDQYLEYRFSDTISKFLSGAPYKEVKKIESDLSITRKLKDIVKDCFRKEETVYIQVFFAGNQEEFSEEKSVMLIGSRKRTKIKADMNQACFGENCEKIRVKYWLEKSSIMTLPLFDNIPKSEMQFTACNGRHLGNLFWFVSEAPEIDFKLSQGVDLKKATIQNRKIF